MKYRVESIGLVVWVAVLAALASCGGGGGGGASSADPAFEAHHTGIVVRLSSDSEVRKPFLRVDVSAFFAPEVGADKIMSARVGGVEGADAMIRGLGQLPPVEEIEIDLNFAADTAEESIKEAFTNAGLPTPQMVRFKSFVIQG